MPSDAKKKREQKKKDAAKRGKKLATSTEQSETNGDVSGATNGVDTELSNGTGTAVI